MGKNRWLSIAAGLFLLSFTVLSAPHTVHHGLDHVNPQDCPVLAISDQTNGELPDLLTLSILTLLPSTDSAPILDLIPSERSLFEVPRNRAPPPSLSS
ncbi:MAG TPA: hypothetical protein VFL31_04230 [Nitrospiraceae bacterium]|nr:hypothetical protein [Nitrospiraceae bacterium]